MGVAILEDNQERTQAPKYSATIGSRLQMISSPGLDIEEQQDRDKLDWVVKKQEEYKITRLSPEFPRKTGCGRRNSNPSLLQISWKFEILVFPKEILSNA
jgi:hypothetical protein